MLFHEVGDLQVSFDFSSGFSGLSPGEVFSRRQGSPSSSFPRVSPVFGQVASLLVADEAFLVPYVLCSFTGREIDFVNIHGIEIGVSNSSSWQDITVSSSSEFPELYHIVVKLSCLVKPLFLFPTSLCLSVREGSSSHHDGELLGYSSLEGVYQDAVIIHSTACLGQFKSDGVLVEVSIELVHTEGINSLAGSVLDVLWDEGFFKGFAYFLESLF